MNVDFKEAWSDNPVVVVDGSTFTVEVKRSCCLWHATVKINGRELSVSSVKRFRLFEKLEKSIKSVLRLGVNAGYVPQYTPRQTYLFDVSHPSYHELPSNIIRPTTPPPVACLREVVND